MLLVRDKEVLSFREHFFLVNEVPHLACVLVWQEAVVPRGDPPQARKPERKSRRDEPDPTADLDEPQRALYNTLREWRAQKAHAEGVPRYVVFSNRQLVGIVRKRPRSANALAGVEGVGAGKVERYGAELLPLLAPEPSPNGSGA